MKNAPILRPGRPLPPTYASPWLALYALWSAHRLRLARIRARHRGADRHES